MSVKYNFTKFSEYVQYGLKNNNTKNAFRRWLFIDYEEAKNSEINKDYYEEFNFYYDKFIELRKFKEYVLDHKVDLEYKLYDKCHNGSKFDMSYITKDYVWHGKEFNDKENLYLQYVLAEFLLCGVFYFNKVIEKKAKKIFN